MGLIEEILEEAGSHQQRFDWLKGDTGVRLPVDAYFPGNKLVVEYREQQHLADRSDSFKLWDKKPTASGINRREQRAKYDRLREEIIPKNGLRLVLVSTSDLGNDGKGHLSRDRNADMLQLRSILKAVIALPGSNESDP